MSFYDDDKPTYDPIKMGDYEEPSDFNYLDWVKEQEERPSSYNYPFPPRPRYDPTKMDDSVDNFDAERTSGYGR